MNVVPECAMNLPLVTLSQKAALPIQSTGRGLLATAALCHSVISLETLGEYSGCSLRDTCLQTTETTET